MRKIIMQIILFIFIANSLFGGYWIKELGSLGVNPFKEVIYDSHAGCFFYFSALYASFKRNGQDVKSRKLSMDNGQDVYFRKTIKLDDGNLFSIGYRFREDSEDYNEKYYYYVFGFTHDGNVLFSKELKNIGINFFTVDLIQMGDKVKLIVSNSNNKGIEGEEAKTAILTFKTDGTLLKAVELSDFNPMDNFGVNFWHSYTVKVDDDYYGIAYSGYLPARNSHYSGIWFFKLNQDDKIVFSKFFGIKRNVDNGLDSSFGPIVIKEEDDGKFLLAAGRDKYINWVPQTNGFSDLIIKLDSNFNIQWSKEYIPQFDLVSLKPINFFKKNEEYTIGIEWCYHYSDNENYYSPIILKTDLSGNLLWSKKYKVGSNNLMWLSVFEKIPLGIAMLTHLNHLFVLDEDGKVPGDENISDEVHFNYSDIELYQKLIEDDMIKISESNIYAEDVSLSFYTEGEGMISTISEYPTMNGTMEYIQERGILSGYYFPHITFRLDPIIFPYVKKFQLFRKFDNDYIFLMDIEKEDDHGSYGITLEGKYNKNNNYEIKAINEKDEVVDNLFF
jgi:hypothetical protein